MDPKTARPPTPPLLPPLPYRVVIRVAPHADAAPTAREFRVLAYSVAEAVAQAGYELCGTLGGADLGTVGLESVGPDLDWWRSRGVAL